jgi:hypothetical protein
MKIPLQLAAAMMFVLLLLPVVLVAQTPASVVWTLTSTDTTSPTAIVGNLSALHISGTDTFRIRSYSGTPVGPLGVNNMRWWPTVDGVAGLSWGPETQENPYRWIQLAVSPLPGNSFTSDSITIWHHAGGTSGMRMNCYASTDPTFATKTKLNPGDTAIYLVQSGTITTRFAFAINLTANPGQTFYYRAYPWYTGAASASKYVYTQLAEIKGTTSPSTDVTEDGSSLLPSEPSLHQNFPNPFNPSTTIAFSLPNRSFVRLAVFNMLGQEVRQLLTEERIAGNHHVRFDATNLPSGLYLVTLNAGGVQQTRAMHLVK